MTDHQAVNTWMRTGNWQWMIGDSADGGCWVKNHMAVSQNVAAEMYRMSERRAAEAEVAMVEGLIDHLDQEADIDGRPVGEPYYVLCGNDREYLEYVLLPQLKSRLAHQPKETAE